MVGKYTFMFETVNILLADDHSVVRRGVSLILRESFPSATISHAESFDAVVAWLGDNDADLLILDINLPGGNSVNMVQDAKAACPGLRVLIFSAFDEEQFALRYLHAGADGFLNKLSSEDKISLAVRTILEGNRYTSEKVKDLIFENTLNNMPHNPLQTLSNRELEIAGMLVSGEGNLEIANRLNLQKSTVSTYKNRIFEKLGVNNVVSLAEKYRLYIN